MKNVKSTVLGVLTILGAIGTAGVALLDGNPETVVNWGATYAAIVAGIGLILMREQAQHDKENGKK